LVDFFTFSGRLYVTPDSRNAPELVHEILSIGSFETWRLEEWDYLRLEEVFRNDANRTALKGTESDRCDINN